jgi:hypothetical protein
MRAHFPAGAVPDGKSVRQGWTTTKSNTPSPAHHGDK